MSIWNVRRGLVVLGLSVAGLLGGCVGQGEYDRLYEINSSVSAQNKELERQLAEQRAQADLLRRGNLNSDGTLASLQQQNADLRSELEKAMASLNDLNKQMAGLEFGRLDPTTDRALTALAEQFPDLIKFDSARGMLRFASDLTFDSGSAVVKENAKAAINALAKVLNSPSASGYEVVVEGHTDSQKISSGTAKMHPTNRHLSAHRAISVTDELGKLGVPSDRMMAAGWGEYRPMVANNSSGNTPQNRRVEIYLARARGVTETANAPASNNMPKGRAVKTTKVDDEDITK